MTTTPDPSAEPADDGRPRHRELGPGPTAARRRRRDPTHDGLSDGEVPARLDRQGQALEAVRVDDAVAASQWDDSLWHGAR